MRYFTYMTCKHMRWHARDRTDSSRAELRLVNLLSESRRRAESKIPTVKLRACGQPDAAPQQQRCGCRGRRAPSREGTASVHSTEVKLEVPPGSVRARHTEHEHTLGELGTLPRRWACHRDYYNRRVQLPVERCSGRCIVAGCEAASSACQLRLGANSRGALVVL